MSSYSILAAKCTECGTIHAIGLLPAKLNLATKFFGTPCPTCEKGPDRQVMVDALELFDQWRQRLEEDYDPQLTKARGVLLGLEKLVELIKARKAAGVDT